MGKMKFRGTFSPWQIDDEGKIVRGYDNEPVAFLLNTNKAKNKDNARLIESAPELLDVCLKMREFLGNTLCNSMDDEDGIVFCDAEAASKMYWSVTDAVEKVLEG